MSSRHGISMAAGLLLAALAGTAAAQPDVRINFDLGLDGPCFPVAEDLLRQGGYRPDRLRRIFDVPRHQGFPGEIRGWQVWARPDSCDGSVVFDFDVVPSFSSDPADCRLLQAWTRGSCPFPVQGAQR